MPYNFQKEISKILFTSNRYNEQNQLHDIRALFYYTTADIKFDTSFNVILYLL